MTQFSIGDRVTLRRTSRFARNGDLNPVGVEGTVVQVDDRWLEYEVEWDGIGFNNYDADDLDLVTPPQRPTHIHGVKVPPSATHYYQQARSRKPHLFKESSTGNLLCLLRGRWRKVTNTYYHIGMLSRIEDYNKPKPVVTKKYEAKELF